MYIIVKIDGFDISCRVQYKTHFSMQLKFPLIVMLLNLTNLNSFHYNVTVYCLFHQVDTAPIMIMRKTALNLIFTNRVRAMRRLVQMCLNQAWFINVSNEQTLSLRFFFIQHESWTLKHICTRVHTNTCLHTNTVKHTVKHTHTRTHARAHAHTHVRVCFGQSCIYIFCRVTLF